MSGAGVVARSVGGYMAGRPITGGGEGSVVPTRRNYFQAHSQAQLDAQTAGLFPRVQMDVASARFLNMLPPRS